MAIQEEVECSRCFRLVEKVIKDSKHIPLCSECYPLLHPEILFYGETQWLLQKQ